ncbi:MAG: hypothetical protein WAZ27_05145 [Minisyncoccia bacterium]
MREKLLNMSAAHFIAVWFALNYVMALGFRYVILLVYLGVDGESQAIAWLQSAAFLLFWGGIIWYFTSRPSRK